METPLEQRFAVHVERSEGAHRRLRGDIGDLRDDVDELRDDVDEINTGFAVFKAEIRTAAKLGSMIGAAIGSLAVAAFGLIGGLIVAALTHHL